MLTLSVEPSERDNTQGGKQGRYSAAAEVAQEDRACDPEQVILVSISPSQEVNSQGLM